MTRNLNGLKKGNSVLLIDGSGSHTPDKGFECIELHSDGSSSPRFVVIILNGLRITHGAIQDIQLHPCIGLILVRSSHISKNLYKLPDLASIRMLVLKGLEVAYAALQVESPSGINAIGLGLLRWHTEDLARLFIDLALLHLSKGPMDEIGLNNVLGNVLHEPDILTISSVQDSGNADDIFAMHVDSNGSAISLIVARFVASAVSVGSNLLIGDVSFHLGDGDCIGAFGTSSFFEVVPKVSIRCGLPIEFVCCAPP